MAYVKSVLWLTGCSGFAYILLETITPKDSDFRKSLPEGHVLHKPEVKERSAFIEVLKKAANEKKSMVHEKPSFITSSTPTVVEK